MVLTEDPSAARCVLDQRDQVVCSADPAGQPQRYDLAVRPVYRWTPSCYYGETRASWHLVVECHFPGGRLGCVPTGAGAVHLFAAQQIIG